MVMRRKKTGKKIYEQRSEPRYIMAALITWSCGDESYTGQVLDISRGGIKIKTRFQMPLLGHISFSSLAAMPLNLTGTVKWISRVDKNYKFGVQFNELTASQIRYLEENCLMNLKTVC